MSKPFGLRQLQRLDLLTSWVNRQIEPLVQEYARGANIRDFEFWDWSDGHVWEELLPGLREVREG